MFSRRIALSDGDVDLRRGEVTRGGRTTPLTTLETSLLRYLYTHRERDIGRDELLTEVWGYHRDVRSRAVDHTVRRVRAKIEVDPGSPRHLLKAHGVGYRLVPAELDTPRASARGFVGRLEELRAIAEALEAGERWLTLRGPGGAGKTSLAERVAADAARASLFVSLGEVVSEEPFLARLASRLGLGPSSRVSNRRARVVAALRDRPGLLIVLDEVERLVDSDGEAFARAIGSFHDDAEVTFVLTSRAATHDPRERCVEVGPMAELDAITLLIRRCAEHGLQLPIERALALVRRLDGLPLSLVLTAPFVAAGSPSAAPVETVFDSSYATLSGDEARLYRACSVFASAFDATLASAVCGIDAAASLEVLADKSLVVRAGERFRLLAPVRAHSAGKLESAGEALPRFRAHAAAVLESGDIDELQRVLDRFLGAARDADRALALRAALRLEERLSTEPLEAQRAVLDAALAASDGSALEPCLRLRRAALRLRDGDPVGAGDDLARAAPNTELAGERALVRAGIHRARGELDDAVALVEEALEASPGGEVEARLRRARGALSIERGEHREALVHYSAALERTTDPSLRLGLTIDAASARMEIGDLEAARVAYESALLGEPIVDRRREAIALANLVALEHDAGRLGLARSRADAAVALCDQLGMRRFRAFAIAGRGFVDLEDGRLHDAERGFEEALTIFRAFGDEAFTAVTLARRGALALERGRAGPAAADFTRARELAGGLAWCLEGIATLEAAGEQTELPEVGSSFGRLARRVVEAIRRRQASAAAAPSG